jgi:molecular chaperone DnaJ
VNHYEVLGIDGDASLDQIRAAFRRRARAAHPDTSASGSVDALTPINEAWRVLGDPALRHAYDRSLGEVRARGPAVVVPVAPPPSSFPWRFLAGLAAVGIGFALFGVFTYRQSNPPPPDHLLERGSCVVIEANRDVVEVNCNVDHDGVVDSLVADERSCSAPLEPHRDRQGLGVVCVQIGQSS